jgi:hypothetical protein
MFLAYHRAISGPVCKNFHSGVPLFGDLGFLVDFQFIDGVLHQVLERDSRDLRPVINTSSATQLH